MTCNASITVYHLNEENDTYEKRIFPEVFRTYTERVLGEKGGFARSDISRVRIPTSEDISVFVGDYVFFGNSQSDVPDKEICLKVMGVRDNRQGANPHWRLDLE